MKKTTTLTSLFLFIVFGSIVLTGCIGGITCVKGNGKIIKQDRKITAFKQLEVSGAYSIVLKQDSITSVSVEADENLQPLITTRIEGNKLIIENKKSICSSKGLKVNISTPDISAIDLSGAVDVKTLNTIKSKELNIDISGMGNMFLDLDVQNLEISCSGMGDINLKGNAENVNAELSGAADIKAFELAAKNFKLSSSGAGKANVNVSDKLDVEISGVATVHYKGNPAISQSISGAGTIKKED
ncbi:MAG: head GIN domain-containing protein [Bacteroidales bacterium]|jgi:hypothetical protein